MNLKLVSESIELKRNEVYALRNAFQQLMRYKGEKFSAFVSKNAHKLDSVIKSFQKHIDSVRPKGDKIEAYLKAEEDILKKFARKDPSGNPIMINNSRYDIVPEHMETMEQEMKEIREVTHKEAWDEIEAFKKDQMEYMDKDVSVEMHKIYDTHLPEDITGADRFPIESYIVEAD